MNEPPPEPPPPANAGAGASPRRGLSDPDRWVDEHGDYLFRYALSRLRDPARAEDLVQETFLAALRAGDSFAGRSSEKSWLVGILKNKIIDHFRKASRETSFTDLEFYGEEESDRFVTDGFFAGTWNHDLAPMEWSGEPGAGLDNELFWKAFHQCTGKLPRSVAQVFLLREMDDLSTEEICSTLGISANNLWVMLHRARMALRRCLETNWFSLQPREGGSHGH